MSKFAMAHAMKKRAKKMADGGEVGGAETSTTGNKTKTGGSNPGGASTGGAGTVTITGGENTRNISVTGVGGKTDAANAGGMDPSDENDDMMMAKGGMVDEPEAAEDADMVSRIMNKRYSKGGMVANDVGIAEADKLPAQYDDLVLRDDLDFSYDAKNSGDELGSEAQDERDEDMIARIMRSRAKKDRMPRPA